MPLNERNLGGRLLTLSARYTAHFNHFPSASGAATFRKSSHGSASGADNLRCVADRPKGRRSSAHPGRHGYGGAQSRARRIQMRRGTAGVRRALSHTRQTAGETKLSSSRDDLNRKQVTEFTDISIRARGSCRVGCDNHCQLKRRHNVDQLPAIAACIKKLSPGGA